MSTIAPDTTDLEDQLREKISELFREHRFFEMDSVKISEVLVAIAFALRDYNGGIGDTCHAANCLHELIDAEGSRRQKDYSPQRMHNYLKKTGQL